MIIINDELEITRKEIVVAYLRHFASIYLDGQRKMTEILLG
jgi:hypothetical protein